ncbi:MAG TPA: hypothetical protein VEX88_13080 [Glaciibacter sp.]|nr:hypothetical protein [Glaciibacter sp.]
MKTILVQAPWADTEGIDVDAYFFDCDKTLYGYNFRKRLPRLAVLTGSS